MTMLVQRHKSSWHIVLALYAVSLIFSISGALLFGGLLILLFLIEVARDRSARLFHLGRLGLPLLLYFLWGHIVSVVNGSLSFLDAVSFQLSILSVLVFTYLCEGDDIRLFFKWVAIGCVVAALWGLVQILLDGSIPSRYLLALGGRPMGTRSHPLTYAETLLPGYFLFLAWILGFKTQKLHWTAVVGFVVLLVTLWLTQSRGVWLAVIVGTAVAAFSAGPKAGLISIVLIVLVNGCFFMGSPALRGRTLSTFSQAQGGSGDQGSKRIRFELWRQSVDAVKKHPVMGVGIKGARFAAVDTAGVSREWSESHNVYLQCAVDQGLVGLVLFLWILWLIFRTILTLNTIWRNGCLGLLTAFLIAGLTESWMSDREIALLFWTFIGCVMFTDRYQRLNEKT